MSDIPIWWVKGYFTCSSGEIPIIAEYVDPAFGTGAVKSHLPNDLTISKLAYGIVCQI